MKDFKSIKARKEHKCDSCDKMILKGELYDLGRHRSPVYDHNDKQIGINYWQIRVHPDQQKCYWPEECRKGNHIMDSYFDADTYSDTCGQTFHFCSECGSSKQEIEQSNISTTHRI